MHKNPVWLFFLTTTGLVVLFFSAKALLQYREFASLDSKAKIKHIEWTIKERGSDHFILEASYSFELLGKSYNGKTVFSKERYLNKWAAEKALSSLSAGHTFVWYAHSNPEQSSLQKNFPLKACVSASALWALFIYFLGLGRYVAKVRPYGRARGTPAENV